MVGVVIGRSPRSGHLQTAGVCGDGAPRLVDRIKEALGIRSGVMDARDDRKALKPLPDEALPTEASRAPIFLTAPCEG